MVAWASGWMADEFITGDSPIWLRWCMSGWRFSTHSLQVIPFSGSRDVTCEQTDGRTDRHGDVIGRIFATFSCERAYKYSMWVHL
jgi:hypothetical protein